MRLAALIKGTKNEHLLEFSAYLKAQVAKLGVKIKLGETVTPSLVEKTKPDVLVLASGGTASVPEIPGIHNRNVVNSAEIHHRTKRFLKYFEPGLLNWLTKYYLPIGKRVIIIGGGLHGCQMAEFLVKRGRQVTILETTDQIGARIPTEHKVRVLYWLHKKGVEMMIGVKFNQITDEGIEIRTSEGKTVTIEADSVLPAMPLTPNAELIKALDGKVPEIHVIGDCREPGLIIDAIADGFRIGHAL